MKANIKKPIILRILKATKQNAIGQIKYLYNLSLSQLTILELKLI